MGLSPSRFGWSFLLAWVFCVFYLGTIDCRFLIEPALHSKSLPFLTQLIVSGLPVFASIATIGYAIAIEPRMGEIADRPRMRVVSPLIASIGTVVYFLPLPDSTWALPVFIAASMATGIGSGFMWLLWGSFYSRIPQDHTERKRSFRIYIASSPLNMAANKRRKGGQKVPKIRDFNRVTALYERLSKDDEQQGESNSILNQKRFLEDFARKSGMTNIKHFTDDGYTGRNFNRPGFQAMLAEAEAGKIGTIIVKDMSRFGRNYLEVGFYTEILFPKKQIRFVAINNSVDSDKPQDNDFTPFLNIMNEWYAKDTSNKIKSIFLSRMNDGKRCSGSIPYGYNRLPEDKQTLVVDPVASQVVKHIFELAAEGLTPPAIARQLTEEKVLIPSAYTLQYHPEQCNRKAAYGCTSWNANTVREILSRQEYLGHTVLRKTIGTNFKTDERRFATDEERLVFEDTHEPIVDSELWELAHRRLKHATRRIKEGTHQEECLLPGLVYCADCGSKMSYQTNYYKSGEPYHSFRCSSYGNRTVNCTIHHISDKVLYQLVLRSIQRLSSHIIADERGFAEELKCKWEAQVNSKPQKQKDELQIINRRLNELDRLIGSLYENLA